METFLQKAKASSRILGQLSGTEKNKILKEMAESLRDNTSNILKENALDMKNADTNNLSLALKDRLLLDEDRIEGMAVAIEEIAALKEPLGRVLDGWNADAGFKIEKVSVPIGVIGVIYESRPNVTADVGALCFKSGNVAILKGGKEAEYSNRIIAKIIQDVLAKNSLPKEAIALLPDSSREGVSRLIKQDKYVDLIVPRGGEALIHYVSSNATVPVVKHDKGLCHTYIDEDADFEKALSVIVNAKCRRTGICGALETLLIDEAIAEEILPKVHKAYLQQGTEIRGCERTREIIEANEASVEDYATEYLDNILTIRVVEGVEGAIEHIEEYGSQHSEAIITENYSRAEQFLNAVDAACVYLNASTQFTDGGVFGFGAEVGISTNKLHARGPMGLSELTTYKYKIYGSGQIR
ncbi:Gamma-glutamyl phosphate reductase [hydrothermal vent metagenome]|uniref:glutamate-5-semialdehyde dehydrogenase n=1 Tax=hydrothermal vent metagenome TaxID=652676 RepID=A0A1W1ED64_9ZZZZ